MNNSAMRKMLELAGINETTDSFKTYELMTEEKVKFDSVKLKKACETFARYLIGDENTAIKEFKLKAGKIGLEDIPGYGSNYNDLFDELTESFFAMAKRAFMKDRKKENDEEVNQNPNRDR